MDVQRWTSTILMGIVPLVVPAGRASAQTTASSVSSVLQERIQSTAVTAFQLQRYLAKRIAKLPSPSSPEQWAAEERELRDHILKEIVFHGWPRDWINAPPRFEQVGVIESGKGYRLRQFRYEVVPGFESTAILYEPETISGRVPAILNLIGHEVAGNAAEYEQKRCINFAKRGILALSLAWFGFGDLAQPENFHDNGADLDLVGSNALGLFYLAMRHGLDYLASLPQTDPSRIGVTGLSGGGWQTTMLGALDPRVAVSVEVAGIGSLESNLVRPLDTDEIEENATDLARGLDYPVLVAMRAPRPTLLIHNAEDDCCFRADLVKPYIFERIRPFFSLFGQPDELAWHENRDPGTHNYQLDNREQAYAFFSKHFGLPVEANEIPSDDEIRFPQELAVALPSQNLTIAGLAKKLGQITRPPIPADNERTSWTQSQRESLKSVVRFTPLSVGNAWRTANSKHLGFESVSYRFDFSDGLSATGVWLKAISVPSDAPITLVLSDQGYKAAGETVSQHINRGEQVLAVDLLFNGTMIADEPVQADWEMLVATAGERPLGLEAAQLLAVANWLRTITGGSQITIEAEGIRSQVISLVAAALEPAVFSRLASHDGMASLRYLLDKPVPYRSAADLFCLDLYEDFDLDRLAMIAAPTEVKRIESAASPAH